MVGQSHLRRHGVPAGNFSFDPFRARRNSSRIAQCAAPACDGWFHPTLRLEDATSGVKKTRPWAVSPFLTPTQFGVCMHLAQLAP